MNEYVLTIKVPIEAVDDIEARKIVTEKLGDKIFSEAELKLQEIFSNKPPRKVELI